VGPPGPGGTFQPRCGQGKLRHPLECQGDGMSLRIWGLPIRDCVVSSNNFAPRCSKLSAIDVTVKTIIERFYLVSGLAPICALSH